MLSFTFLALTVLLSACAGGANAAPSSYPGMTANQDTVFVAYNAHIYALNLQSGAVRWLFPSESNAQISFYASPVLTADGKLVAGAYNHVLYGIDPATGQELWSFKEAGDRYIAPALVYNGLIFAPNADGNLYAIEIQNGNTAKRLWTFETGGELWATPSTDPQCNCIFLPSMDHHLYSIDAQNGSQNWKTEDLGGAIVGKPAYGPDRTLYLGTFNREMLAIDATNGQIRWRVPTQGWVWGGPALVDGKLYFGDLDGYFYALDAANGELVWQNAIQADGPIAETPIIDGTDIYFTTRAGSVYSANMDGKATSKNIGGTLYTAPLRVGDLLLVATTNNQKFLIANDLNINEKWFYPPKE